MDQVPTVKKSSEAAGESDGNHKKNAEQMKAAMLVVMSLIASVTYQAGLAQPHGMFSLLKPQEGGTTSLSESTPSAAPAVSTKAGSRDTGRSLAFATLNGFAFSCSVCNMLLLMTEFVFSSATTTDLRVIKGFMSVSLVAMGLAYGAGSCPDWHCTWNYCMWVPFYFTVTAIIYLFIHRWREKKKEEEKKTAATSEKPAQREIDADVEMQSVQARQYSSGSYTI